MTRISSQTEADEIELSIRLEKVCYIIFKAREFDAKVAPSESDPASNPSDDKDAAVLEDYADDPVLEELTTVISESSVDEQVDLVTLMWLGRGEETTVEDWESLRSEAADSHNARTAEYLCGTPLLADYLSDGLSILGYSCADYELEHL